MAQEGRGRTTRLRSGPGAVALVGSFVLHGALVAGFWFYELGSPSPLPPLKAYRVEIVSTPPIELGPQRPAESTPPRVTAPTPEPEVSKPEPVKPEPPKPVSAQPETKAPPKAEPKPEPKETPSAPAAPVRDPAPKPTGPNPAPNARVGGEGMNVQIDGEAFPFPEYLENILVQISRYFRWTGASGLRAEIYFVILPDGSVEDIRILQGSGDIDFNLEAVAAIEQAGRRRAFGPLPDAFGCDRLPVSFYFQPAR